MVENEIQCVSESQYVIITPVRDEIQYIGKTISSVIRQTVSPLQWIIVDDGSTDGTSEILDQTEKEHSWIRVIHRKDRGHRYAGGGVMEAFHDGFHALSTKNWAFLVKLDGDLSFEPDYFQKCFQYFRSNPKLGIAGGTVTVIRNGKTIVDSQGDPPFHVRGATKIYKRECWKEISPLVRAPGWDTIDEVRANAFGWSTRTFEELALFQHKPTGGADGSWRNWFKNGRANYITGYHPIFMLAKCFKRAVRKPLLMESFALWAGFVTGYFKGIPQMEDKKVVRYLRRQQIRHLFMRPSIYTRV